MIPHSRHLILCVYFFRQVVHIRFFFSSAFVATSFFLMFCCVHVIVFSGFCAYLGRIFCLISLSLLLLLLLNVRYCFRPIAIEPAYHWNTASIYGTLSSHFGLLEAKHKTLLSKTKTPKDIERVSFVKHGLDFPISRWYTHADPHNIRFKNVRLCC